MHEVELRILEPGFSSVQDLGRYGGSQLGLPVGGSADQYSAQCANALVGNDFDSPVIEVTASGLGIVTGADVLLAVTGAACEVSVDGVHRPQWAPIVAHAGQVVRLSPPRLGVRSYLAVSGWILARELFGSVSPDPSLGNGWFLGAGDVVRVSTRFRNFDHPYARLPLLRPPVRPLRMGQPWRLRVLAGPHWDECDGASGWLEPEFTVAGPSNSVGLRLDGPTGHTRPPELLSRGVPIGAIEMPAADEGLLVLLRGRMLTAGYPVPAVVASADHSLLGQVAPGDRIRFCLIRRVEALGLLRAQRLQLRTLADHVHAMLEAAGSGLTRGHTVRVPAPPYDAPVLERRAVRDRAISQLT